MAGESPIQPLLAAFDRLDVEAAVAMFAPDARLLAADGRRADGAAAIRELIADFVAALRSTTHQITNQWHVDDAWIAEVDASYELHDYLQLNGLPRAVVIRDGPEGISDMRVYGAHEHPVTEHRTGEEGMWVGGHWLPPL